jgi:hypothetical protein
MRCTTASLAVNKLSSLLAVAGPSPSVPAAVLLLLAPVAAASELVPPALGVLLPLRGGLLLPVVLCALLVCAFAIALEATILLQTHDRVVKGASELFPSASCAWLSALLSLLLASAGNAAPAAVTATLLLTWLLLAPLSSPDVLLITLCCRVMFTPAVNLPLLVPLLPLAVVLVPVLVAMTLVLRNVAPR